MLKHLREELRGEVLVRSLLLEVIEGELELRDRLLHLLVLVHAEHTREHGGDDQ